ncbi:MAG: hypothetical protein FJW83_12440, partial [Actinobacteria bacterium]|nr:hypothetical protein [Actinomycetota bacterium]
MAPPASAIGRCPASWNRRSVTRPIRFPTCRESAVGSKPQYSAIGPDPSRARNATRSVVSATSPRATRSSNSPGSTVATPRICRVRAPRTKLCAHRFGWRIGENGGVRGRPVALLLATILLGSVLTGCAYRVREVDVVLPAVFESSRVFAADGTLITRLRAEVNRDLVPYSAFPKSLVDATIAIEDRRFFQHNGVDPQGILRAAGANAAEGGIAQGGSTITQQYVKNALLGPEQTVNRKLREIALAWQLERTTSKELILELYLNTVYFGQGAYGAEAAAQTYFAKSVTALAVEESAVLAGLIQLPSVTDPFNEPELALARRNVVLDAMLETGAIDDAEHARATAAPITLGKAAPEPVERYPAGHFVEEVKKWILADPRFGDDDEARRRLLFGGGLRIYTTLDLAMQTAGEAAIASVLPDGEGLPEASILAMDPRTGHVRAMVGGRDYFGTSPFAKFNLAVGEGRQSGSSFKPLVLAAALDEGVPLGKIYPAPPEMTIPVPGQPAWVVRNYGGSGGDAANLVLATISSYNTVYAQLMRDVGPEDAVAMAARLGVRSPLQPVYAAVLGTENVTGIDMATAYSTFANRGIRTDPVLVTKITDAAGNVLFEAPVVQERVISESVADQMNAVLADVICCGTGTAARIGRPAAGKTGTAESYRDAWFVGYTPNLTAAVWVGFPEAQIAMVPPRTPVYVSGGSYPARIWGAFMGEATTALAPEGFVPPSVKVAPVVQTTTTVPTTTTRPT